jgi:hypothetical protein
VPLALSSDAPYGPLNPWSVIASAACRRTESGVVVGPAERLDPAAALAAYLAAPEDPGGAPRRIREQTPTDLILLDRPLAAVLTDLPTNPVRASSAPTVDLPADDDRGQRSSDAARQATPRAAAARRAARAGARARKTGTVSTRRTRIATRSGSTLSSAINATSPPRRPA